MRLILSILLVAMPVPALAGDIGDALELAEEMMEEDFSHGLETVAEVGMDEAFLIVVAADGGPVMAAPFVDLGSRAEPDELQPLVAEAAHQTGLPTALLDAVIRTESGYRPNAVSRTGAIGLMQLMPATARELGVQDPYDPRQNIFGGARYLKQLIDRFQSVRLGVAAYNAGPGAVEKHGGVPPFRETQGYVRTVMARYGQLAAPTPANFARDDES